MRALHKLLIGICVGNVAVAEVGADAGKRGPDSWEVAPPASDDAGTAGPGASVLEPWPDFAAPAVPPPSASAGAGAYALVEELHPAPPVFLAETGGGAGGGGAGLFDKGTWSLQLTGSYYSTVSGSDVTLGYGTASLGYYYADTWAIDVSVSGYALEEDDDPEGVAASLGLNLRKHFFVRDPWSVYIDGGVGMIRADGEFPAGGTNTNFTLQAGLGATYRLNESLHLVGGARWFHISNARRHGEDENASTDGVAVYGGLMWTW